MKVRVLIQHNVDPALLDILEKVDTAAGLEICGPEALLYDVDMSSLQEDIQKVAREADRINRVYEKAGYPWIAREVLEGRAVIDEANRLIYMSKHRPRTLKEKLETIVGPLNDRQFGEIMQATTDDIRENMVAFGRYADINTVIKIAAQAFEALKRCGI